MRLQEARTYARSQNATSAMAQTEEARARLRRPGGAGGGPRPDHAATNVRYKQLVRRLEGWNGVPGERKNDADLLAAAAQAFPDRPRHRPGPWPEGAKWRAGL